MGLEDVECDAEENLVVRDITTALATIINTINALCMLLVVN